MCSLKFPEGYSRYWGDITEDPVIDAYKDLFGKSNGGNEGRVIEAEALLRNWLDWYESLHSKPPGLMTLALQTRNVLEIPEE